MLTTCYEAYLLPNAFNNSLYILCPHTEATLGKHVLTSEVMAIRTWSRNTQPARWIVATLSFNCGSTIGAIEEVGRKHPWRDRARPRHTHPVPEILDKSLDHWLIFILI